MHSFGHAAGTSVDVNPDPEELNGSCFWDLVKEALQGRSQLMFSGKTGRPVASGIKADAATCTTPSFSLVGLKSSPPHTTFTSLDPAHMPHIAVTLLDRLVCLAG